MTRAKLEQDIADIIRRGITFSPQVGDYVIHGAIKEIGDMVVSLLRENQLFNEDGECVWKEVVDTPHRRLIDNCDRYYKTSCDKAWASFEGRTPEQNAYKFCMGCGKLIRIER